MKLLLETQAARDVLAERKRQVEAEGWTPEHDDQHEVGELAGAAACYAANASGFVWIGGWPGEVWPWAREWWKPSTPRRDLVKAAALILAEIERLDREAAQERPKCGVRGAIQPGAMCGHVIVGGEHCGFSGECEHKQ